MTSAPEAHKTAGVLELLPCPFCGARLEHSDDLSTRRAKFFCHPADDERPCLLACFGSFEGKDALSLWNTRSTPSVPAVAELSGEGLPLPAASGAASGWMPKEISEDIDTLAIEACRHFHMDVIPEAFREGLAYRAIVLAITWDRASSSGLPRGVAGAAELASLQTENRKLKADLRSYEITFNMMHETAAERDVLAERRRQIAEEGWTPEHDDEQDLGQLGLAAALYAIPYETVIGGEPMLDQDTFIGLDMALEIVGGWDLKPETDTRRRKVKAAALLLAEIERLDRKEAGNGVS